MNKFLIVGACFAVVAVSAGPAEYMKYLQECKAETGSSNDDLKSVMSYQNPTEKGWCLTACLSKKTGAMGPDNKLVWDKALEELAPIKQQNPAFYAKLVPAMQECKDQIESNAANLATPCIATKARGECIKGKM